MVLPETALLSVIIVTNKFTLRVNIETKARITLLLILSKEIIKDPFSIILVINVISLFLSNIISI